VRQSDAVPAEMTCSKEYTRALRDETGAQNAPFVIRKCKNNKWQSVTLRMVNRLGYYHVKLETNIPLHRVIAEQFIDNPDKLPRGEYKSKQN
jgi:hypothetical protein